MFFEVWFLYCTHQSFRWNLILILEIFCRSLSTRKNCAPSAMQCHSLLCLFRVVISHAGTSPSVMSVICSGTWQPIQEI